MSVLEQVLEKIKHLDGSDELDLSWMELDDTDAEQLAAILLQNSHIKKANLYGNKFGDKGVGVLASISSLEELDLSYNPIGTQGIYCLASSKISSLKIRGNKNLGSESITALAGSQHLKKLDAGECNLGNQNAKTILSSTVLEELILDTNGLNSSSVAGVLCGRNLYKLSLAQNDLGDEGAEQIAAWASLREVNLELNKIGDRGALAFEHSQVCVLNLAQNRVKVQGFLGICRSKTLTHVSLCSNGISFEDVEQLPISDSLSLINLSSNAIAGEPIQPLQDLVRFPKLETIILRSNKIGDGVAQILYENKGPLLVKLDLGGNPIQERALIAHGYNLKRSREPNDCALDQVRTRRTKYSS